VDAAISELRLESCLQTQLVPMPVDNSVHNRFLVIDR
jgi:hypothetical protein